MFLIVGLGNPGNEYKNTRHNIGFDVIDKLANVYKIDINRSKFKGICGEGRIGLEKVILLKPLTYMNLSGESVREVCDYFKIEPENIIVVHDDVSIDVGRIRIRAKGSSGGQNGVKNIILHLSTDEFNRVKVGVGKPQGDMVSHVLGRFSEEDRKLVEQSSDAAIQAIEVIIKDDINVAMNKFNGFKPVEN